MVWIYGILFGVLIFYLYAEYMVKVSEDDRIRTLFIYYRNAKKRYPDLSESELLAKVAGEHTPPNAKGRRLRSVTDPQKYIEGVFEGKRITLNELIYHIIIMEFPENYKFEVNFRKKTEKIKQDSPSSREILENKILFYRQEILKFR